MQHEISNSASNRKQEVFELAKMIISGERSVSTLEFQVSLKENISKPAIMSVFKGESIQVGFTVTKILVARFVDTFGFATKMNPTQLETLVLDTFDNFRGESLGDIVLFFKMARNGQFGSAGHAVDSNLIFGDWFPKYLALKSEEREKVYMKEKGKLNSEILSLEDVKKAYDKLKKTESKIDIVKSYVDKITDGITRDELENLITEWRADEEKSKYIFILIAKRTFIK